MSYADTRERLYREVAIAFLHHNLIALKCRETNDFEEVSKNRMERVRRVHTLAEIEPHQKEYIEKLTEAILINSLEFGIVKEKTI